MNHHLIFSSTITRREGLGQAIKFLREVAEEAILSESQLLLEVYKVEEPHPPANPSQIEKTEEMLIRDRMMHNPSHVCEP